MLEGILFDICFLIIHILVKTVFMAAYFVFSIAYAIVSAIIRFIWRKLKAEGSKLKSSPTAEKNETAAYKPALPSYPSYNTAEIGKIMFNNVYTLKRFPSMPAGTDPAKKAVYFNIFGRISDGYRTNGGAVVTSYKSEGESLKIAFTYNMKKYVLTVHGYKRKNFDVEKLFDSLAFSSGKIRFLRCGEVYVGQISYDVLIGYQEMMNFVNI